MSRKHPFVTGEFYHVYNRGTEKRDIFLDEIDYKKFVFMMFKFNRPNRVGAANRDFKNKNSGIQTRKTNHDILVRIHAYCLMPNHYHIVLEQLVDGGISKFLQKVMTGYTMYFNKKYERSGALFQGKTRSKYIESNQYFLRLQAYIALNPLDLKYPKWKERGVPSSKKAREFLEKYKWKNAFDYDNLDRLLLLSQYI